MNVPSPLRRWRGGWHEVLSGLGISLIDVGGAGEKKKVSADGKLDSEFSEILFKE